MEILENNPLKVFELYAPSRDNIAVTFKNVIDIFESLSHKRLRYFYLNVKPTISSCIN